MNRNKEHDMKTYNDMKIFRSFLEATESLPPEQFKEAWLAVMHYGMDGVEDDLSPTGKLFLAMAKPVIDNSLAIREGNSRGGKKSNEVDAKSNEVDAKSKQVDTKSNEVDTKSKQQEEGIRNKEYRSKDNNIKESRRFTPPSLQEVREYCSQRGNKVDPEQFIDFYESKGWKVGAAAMKDWKAAVRTWEKRDTVRKHEQNQKNRFNQFEQRDYDYDALEAELLGIGGTA